MGLEITVISSIRLDAEVFSQRIFSIGKRICGFTWGKNGGRNKLLKLNLGPGTMASQLYTHAFNISPIEDRRLCINGTPWIWHLLEECVENAWEYWSVVIGLISIVCFLFAALPQIYVACQNGRVDQALSLGFLLGWIAGDLTNFIGCYLTNQLPIQIVTAIFYVNMDIIMISQFVYYKLKNQKTTKCSKSLKSFCITWIVVCIALCVTLLCQLLLRNKDQSTVIERSNTSLDMIEMSGFICGYISCVFYLGSRFPQLYKNFQRRSTEGTSYLLFALAMVGNCTYGLSLVLKMPATESFRALYFLHHLPWLIGSFGVLFLDIFHCLPARYCHVAGWWWFTFVKTVFWYLLLCTSIYCGNLCFVRCYAYFLAWSREEYIKEGHSWLGYLCSKSIILSESWNHQEKEQVTAQFILYRQHKERESGLVALEVEPLLVNEEAA